MKKTIELIMTSILLSLAPALTAQVDPAFIRHWQLNGSPVDSEQHATLSLVGDTNWVAGVDQEALQFTHGAYAYLDTLDFALGNAERTLVLAADLQNENRDELLFAFGDTRPGTGFELMQSRSGLGVNFGSHFIGTSETFDGWTNIALVIPPGASTTADIQLYINGTLVNNENLQGAARTMNLVNTGTAYLGANLRLNSVPGGTFDEIRVYNRALSAEEIAEIYAVTRPAAYWGQIRGELEDQSDLVEKLAEKQDNLPASAVASAAEYLGSDLEWASFAGSFDINLASKTTDDLAESQDNKYECTTVDENGLSLTDYQITLEVDNDTLSTASGVLEVVRDDLSDDELTQLEDVNTSAPQTNDVLSYADGVWTNKQILPTGMIMLWYGDVYNIPEGWALCDGSQGTPDLRGRFVVGAGGEFAPGTTGGAAQHSHTAGSYTSPAHTHAAGNLTTPAHTHGAGSYTAGNHTHSFSGRTSRTGIPKGDHEFAAAERGSFGWDNNASFYDEGNIYHDHTFSGTTSGSGKAPISGSSGSGGGGPLNGSTAVGGGGALSGTSGSASNLPPYYALVYIMKL